VFLSIIIPCFNEEATIASTLFGLEEVLADKSSELAEVEVILVDGGSKDATLNRIKEFQGSVKGQLQVKLHESEKGRAKQMNKGAELTQGKVLLFLHADTHLPASFAKDIALFFSQKEKVWGCFSIKLDGKQPVFRLIEWFVNQRSRLTNVVTGDQVLFVKRSCFESLKGFPDIPLMEDVALSKKLRRESPAYRINKPVITSSRRWQSKGVIKTVLLMWYLRFAYSLGVKPESLHKKYYSQ
jgi:rSAM/selenodomain-associated transferase 2